VEVLPPWDRDECHSSEIPAVLKHLHKKDRAAEDRVPLDQYVGWAYSPTVLRLIPRRLAIPTFTIVGDRDEHIVRMETSLRPFYLHAGET